MPGSCCRARASRPGTGSRSSTRPGLIDSGYRGEIRVLLLNTDRAQSHDIAPGDRIAQLMVVRHETPAVVEVDELPGSERGGGGFGSSGTGGFGSGA